MSFHTHPFDLSQTIFTEEHLQEAREYLSALLTKVDPSLKKPQGVLRAYWETDSPAHACELISIAQMLKHFERGLSSRSALMFLPKVAGIFKQLNEKTFLENLTELQIGSELAHHTNQLEIDPLVPDEWLLPLTNHRRPQTPDFALHILNEKVFFEATVLHTKILNDWDKSVDSIMNALKSYLRKQQQNLTFQMTFPLPFKGNPEQIIKRLCYRLEKADRGRETFENDGGDVRWEPLPTFIAPDASAAFATLFTTSSKVAVFSPTPENVGFASATQSGVVHLLEEDRVKANNFMLNSLRNTLKTKKDQLQQARPVVLVLGLGHIWLYQDELLAKLYGRIWNSPDYDWITGIVLFTPRHDFRFSQSDTYSPFLFCPNVRAKHKMNDILSSFLNKNDPSSK